jgi:hypothetical protein
VCDGKGKGRRKRRAEQRGGRGVFIVVKKAARLTRSRLNLTGSGGR